MSIAKKSACDLLLFTIKVQAHMRQLLRILNQVIKNIRVVFILLPYCWMSVFSILLMWYLLWWNNQGQDILIDLSDSIIRNPHSQLFLISIVVLAFYNWFLPKTSFKRKFDISRITTNYQLDKDQGDLLSSVRKFLPRYLSYLTIIIAGYSITHVGELQRFYGSEHGTYSIYASFIAGIIPLIFPKIINSFFTNLISKPVRIVVGAAILFLALVLLPPIARMLTNRYSDFYFISFLISPFVFGMFMYGLYTVRTILKSDNLQPGGILHRFVEFIKDDSEAGPFYKLIYYTAGIFVFAHIYFNVQPHVSMIIGPGPVFIIAILALVIIVNTVLFWLMKIRNKNKSVYISIGIIATISMIFSCNNKKFQVNLLESETTPRIAATEHSKNWLDSSVVHNSDSTIYLVASYGGGIRATYWTNLILARYMDATDGEFLNQTFGLSGSSGGMVGQGIFVGLGKDLENYKDDNFTYFKEVDSLYRKGDYLSPMISRLLGFDLIKSLIPIPGPDRHRSLEQLFEQRMESIGKGSIFKNNFLDYWYKNSYLNDETRPILVCNSTYSQQGIRATYSPIRLDNANTSLSIDLFEELEKIDTIYNNRTYGGIPFSTAALQSARFPYASPPGTFPNGMQFVDAGYYDNMGGNGVLDLLKVLTRTLECEPYKYHFKIKVIIINSTPIEKENSKDESSVKAYSGILNPLNSFMNTRGGHTRGIEDALKDYIISLRNDQLFDISVIASTLLPTTDYIDTLPDGSTRNLEYIYPLGWYLSKKSLEGMHDKAANIDIWREDSLATDAFMMDVEDVIEEFDQKGCISTQIKDCSRYRNIAEVDISNCPELDQISEKFSEFMDDIVNNYKTLRLKNANKKDYIALKDRYVAEIKTMNISENDKSKLREFTNISGYISHLQSKTDGVEIKATKRDKAVIDRPTRSKDVNRDIRSRPEQEIQQRESSSLKKLEKINPEKIKVKNVKGSS